MAKSPTETPGSGVSAESHEAPATPARPDRVATNSPNQAPSPLDIALSEEPSESSYAAPSASMAPLGLAVLLGDDLSDDDSCSYEADRNIRRMTEGSIRNEWKMWLGPNHQAEIPPLLTEEEKQDAAAAPPFSGTLLWDPSKIPPEDLQIFIKVVREAYHPKFVDFDKVMELVVKNDYDYKKITLELLYSRSADIFSLQPEDILNSEEIEKFLEGLRLYQKDFQLIRSQLLPHKTIAELVHFYYLWKVSDKYPLLSAGEENPPYYDVVVYAGIDEKELAESESKHEADSSSAALSDPIIEEAFPSHQPLEPAEVLPSDTTPSSEQIPLLFPELQLSNIQKKSEEKPKSSSLSPPLMKSSISLLSSSSVLLTSSLSSSSTSRAATSAPFGTVSLSGLFSNSKEKRSAPDSPSNKIPEVPSPPAKRIHIDSEQHSALEDSIAILDSHDLVSTLSPQSSSSERSHSPVVESSSPSAGSDI